MVWTQTHVPGCFFFSPSGVALRSHPTRQAGARPQHNGRLCAREPSDTRVELGFGGLFRLIKRDALLFMQARETALGAGGDTHQRHLSSSTFTSTQGSFHRTLRSIWCFAACNGKEAAGAISEGTWAAAHLHFIWRPLILRNHRTEAVLRVSSHANVPATSEILSFLSEIRQFSPRLLSTWLVKG